jgi:threonine dehydratase
MIGLAEIEAARERIAGPALRTPLVRLHVEDAPAEIYLKLENLQPINSFKIRGAVNAVMLALPAERAKGLVTASAGNMAQGVAWTARELGVPATIVVPDHAPEVKLAAIERLGGRVLKIPYDAWWDVIVTSHADGLDGLFIHPVQDRAVMAGNGTIGLEILEDLPDPDAVVIPYGGGGLTTGIASAVRALRPGTRIVTAEPDTAAAMAAAAPPGTRPTSTTAPRSWTARAAAACLTACGRWSRRSSTTPWPSRWPRSPPPCARSPSGSGSSPRARARSPRPPR